MKKKTEKEGKGWKKKKKVADTFAVACLSLDAVKESRDKNGKITDEGRKHGENAFNCFKTAADKGHAEAQCRMGWYYMGNDETGQVKQNPVTAFEWFEKAADQGNVEAGFIVGQCYHRGIGVVKDQYQAHDYFSVAASKFHVDAQVFFALMLKAQSGTELEALIETKKKENPEENLNPISAILEIAIPTYCTTLHASAAKLFELGQLYEKGERPPLKIVDYEAALIFYELAIYHAGEDKEIKKKAKAAYDKLQPLKQKAGSPRH